MEIKSVEFVASYPRETACPKDGLPEFAFIGRSNVGKSSLINMLTVKGLAKVSGTPGKTQLLNYFLINSKWYLVDLPGYGYAKVSKEKQRSLSGMINGYFLNREQLSCAFILIDSNIPPTKIDIDFVNGFGEHSIPFAIVFTKIDRVGKMTVEKNVGLCMDKLAETWETPPHYFLTSSEYKNGKEEILDYIGEALKNNRIIS